MIKAAATLKSLQFRQTNLTDCYGRLSFGPVNPGQGLTIGNALRRILLNDLPGIGFKLNKKNIKKYQVDFFTI